VARDVRQFIGTEIPPPLSLECPPLWVGEGEVPKLEKTRCWLAPSCRLGRTPPPGDGVTFALRKALLPIVDCPSGVGTRDLRTLHPPPKGPFSRTSWTGATTTTTPTRNCSTTAPNSPARGTQRSNPNPVRTVFANQGIPLKGVQKEREKTEQ